MRKADNPESGFSAQEIQNRSARLRHHSRKLIRQGQELRSFSRQLRVGIYSPHIPAQLRRMMAYGGLNETLDEMLQRLERDDLLPPESERLKS